MAEPKLQSFSGSVSDPLMLGKSGLGNFNKIAGSYLSAQADQQWEREQPSLGLLQLEHLSPTIGSVVSGLDLSKPLSPELVTALRRELLLRKVLFFRDQDMSSERLVSLGRHFGELEIHPFTASKEGFDEILMVDHGKDTPGTENLYHSDVSWRPDPSLGSILYCRETPAIGGDTIFVDMYAAYEGLPDRLKEQIDGKTAEHDWHFFRLIIQANSLWSDERVEQTQQEYPPQHHPIVRTHPETGRDILYVNAAFTKQIDGMEWKASEALLKELYAHAHNPEYQVRFKWQEGCVAFWDNRCCQHYAIADYWPKKRVMERVTIRGDLPFNKASCNEKSKL